MTPGPRVLVVCTANQCRSPLAEFLLRRAVTDRGLHWQLSSAGTHALPGLSLHPFTERLLRSRDFDVTGWTTTPVTEQLLDDHDLVLTASAANSSVLLSQLPRLRTKIITLRRFARLAASARQSGGWSPSDDLSPLLQLVARPNLPGAGHTDDLADPVGHPYRRFKTCARDIDQAAALITGR